MAFSTNTALLPTKYNHIGGARTSLINRQCLKVFCSRRAVVMSGGTTAIEKEPGMRLIKQADEMIIEKMGCRSWSVWTCEPSTFPWSYAEDEVCLVVSGEFTVIPDDGKEPLDVEAGDIAYFPKGLACTWKVRKAIKKHYTFGQSF